MGSGFIFEFLFLLCNYLCKTVYNIFACLQLTTIAGRKLLQLSLICVKHSFFFFSLTCNYPPFINE